VTRLLAGSSCVQFPAEKRFFEHVQPFTGSHLVSCPVGTRFSLPVGKVVGLKAAQLPLSKTKVKNEWRHTSLPHVPSQHAQGLYCSLLTIIAVCVGCQCSLMYKRCKFLTVLTVTIAVL
jgi:hypothetical protein